MKKIIALLLALMMLLSFAAVAEEEEALPIAGGWTFSELNAEIPEDALTAFNTAIVTYKEDWDEDLAFTPVALLATQVVAGTNYLFLCTDTPEDNPLGPDWVFVEVYADLEGRASVDSISWSGLNQDDSDDEIDFQYETEMNDDCTILTVRIDCNENTGTDWDIAIDDETTFELLTCEYAPYDETDENGVIGQFVASFRAVDGVEFVTDSLPFYVQIKTVKATEDGSIAYFDVSGDIYSDSTLEVWSCGYVETPVEE